MSLRPELLIVLTALCVVTIVLGSVIVMLFRRQARTLAEKLRSDSRYRTVIDQAGDGIFLVDAATGRLTEANSSLRRKLGYSAEEIVGLKVEQVLVENETVVAVKAKGQILDVAGVISTAPANILARLVTGTHAIDDLKAFRFRPMIFVNMKFKGRGLLPDTVLWFPERDFPFFRLTEATWSMPWLAPPGKTMITVDIGCEKGDENWEMPDDELIELSLAGLARVIPGVRDIFIGANILRTPIAYPVYLNEYEAARRSFERSTNVDRLLSIGRNGEFSHIFMEDVYWRTQKKVSALIKSLSI